MIKKILIIITVFTLLNCKKEHENKKSANKETNKLLTGDAKDKCDVPDEIRSYITSNKDFELLTAKDLKLIEEFIKPSICPTYTNGDFNHNGKDDIAVIVRYKGYKSEEYASYIYPFLVIFNDYKDGIKPNIIYKTGDYKEEPIKTVIYDQYNEGIISYLKKSKVCEQEVIDIVIPEKSSFFVYWNQNKSTYEFLNYLDENLCQKVSNKVSNNNYTEINNLFKKFILKFSKSKIETNNNKPIIKISLTSKKNNKTQEIDFIPEALLGSFNESPLNYSYFSDEKQIIETSEGTENYHKLIVLDVNFDGLEDFAIINYEGGNGGPQYAYYIQESNEQFVLDTYLTESMRFFPIEINKHEKTLTIGHPSGCCKIRTYKIQIKTDGTWKELFSKLEDIK